MGVVLLGGAGITLSGIRAKAREVRAMESYIMTQDEAKSDAIKPIDYTHSPPGLKALLGWTAEEPPALPED